MNNINRELAELLGLRWYEATDGIDPKDDWKFIGDDSMAATMWGVLDNPDFTTDSGKIELLRLMMKQCKSEYDFAQFLFGLEIHGTYALLLRAFIETYMTDTTGRLAQAAVEFLRKEPR